MHIYQLVCTPSPTPCRPGQRFSALAAICDDISQLLGGQNTSAGGQAPYLGGVGTDPTFMSSSTMYKPSLVSSDWYNSSTGSGELNLNGVPYGFFHTELPGESPCLPKP